jgi:hypothetical protein
MNMKSCMLLMWGLLDPVYYSFSRLKKVGNAAGGNILRVKLLRYRGAEMLLADGTCIHKGDLLVKIHLHNVRLLKKMLTMSGEVKRGKYVYRRVEASLPELGAYIRNHRKFEEIKAIIGVTMLNKGTDSLGFETHPIPGAFYRIFKWATQLPLYCLFVSEPIRSLKKHSIQYIIMSKDTLLARHCRL